MDQSVTDIPIRENILVKRDLNDQKGEVYDIVRRRYNFGYKNNVEEGITEIVLPFDLANANIQLEKNEEIL